MTGVARCLGWWIDPWLRAGSPFPARAVRVLVLSAALVATVLPAMIWTYGLDGWLWPLTFAVVTCGPLGSLALDQGAEILDRPRRAPGPLPSFSEPRRLGTALRLVAMFLGLSLGVLVAYALVAALPVLPEDQAALLAKDYRRTMRILGGVIVALAVAGSLLWFRAEAWRLQASVDRARFDTLKTQMQPHFLFNTLASLKELIALDPARAEEATQRVADLYRMLLEVSKHPTAPLKDELSVVESYLRIEQIRYGERLRVALDVEPGVEDLHVPSLMLQTLAENAVKHGVAKARAGGEVRVAARRRPDGWLELCVSNTGAPFDPRGSEASSRTGLANTAERLVLMYGAASGFSVASDPVTGTTVRFAVSGREVTE